MSPLNILAAEFVLAILVLGTCAIVAIRRWWDRVNANRAAAVRHIEQIHREIRGGGRHGERFTLAPTPRPHGKETHVSSPAERTQNHG